MKVDWPTKMANLQMPVATVFVGVFLAILVTSFFSLNEFTSTMMASGTIQFTEEQEENVVHIIRDSMASYLGKQRVVDEFS
jgi:hypothetical protein